MVGLIETKGIQVIVDASHPFAEEASENAISAAKTVKVPYIRYERESQTFQYEKLKMVRKLRGSSRDGCQEKRSGDADHRKQNLTGFYGKIIREPRHPAYRSYAAAR